MDTLSKIILGLLITTFLVMVIALIYSFYSQPIEYIDLACENALNVTAYENCLYLEQILNK